MREISIFQVDAFAEALFAGNPAAICPLQGEWLPDRLMQAIAAENNLAETAFLLPRGDSFAIRWFTPKLEVDLCGHATLASAYVVHKHLDSGCTKVSFQSASGPLTVFCEEDNFTLDFPARPGTPTDDTGDAVVAALGLAPQEVLMAPQMLAVLASDEEVRGVVPDLDRIVALPARGLIITGPASTAGGEFDFVSRYFAPKGGIPEDPVTGSAHCTLAPYWSKRLGKRQLKAYQASSRGGALALEDRGDRIAISGRAVPYLEGRIYVP